MQAWLLGYRRPQPEWFDKMLERKTLAKVLQVESEPPGARTLNLLIKSQLLYLLS